MRYACILALLLASVACNRTPNLVIIQRLAPGGGGAGTSAHAQFDLLVRMQGDATDFNAGDLMRLHLDGEDRTADLLLGGFYGLLRIDPPTPGLHTVELFAREGPRVDSFTWTVVPYTGPTLTGVAPDTAEAGTPVTITGTGFGAAPLRVFFGGVEGTVDGSSATSITATVPAGALPGLVWVLVGSDSAEGIVGFLPLDGDGFPIPFRSTPISSPPCRATPPRKRQSASSASASMTRPSPTFSSAAANG
ncbi:MAG: hypothetical protein HC813_03720 [Planctomycetes bacterium]|nr:hypothetical protein [Planctomycetota bacterium]